MTGPPSSTRVLLVVDSLDGGGGERHVVGLASELDRRGHAVTLACSTSGVLAGALASTGVAVRPLMPELVKRRFSPLYAERLRRLVLDGAGAPPGAGDRPGAHYDVVHAHMYASCTAAAAATWRTGVPLVITEHTEAPWRGAGARELSRVAYRCASGIVAVSSAIRDLLVTSYAVPPAAVRVCLPAEPPLPGRAALLPSRAARPASRASGRVGYVGRLQQEKGVDVLLRALAALRSRRPEATLTVVGDGPQRGQLEKLAADGGLADAVQFAGYLADPGPVLAELDVLVVPSRSDGTPIVVLEGQRAGVPVVASAVGGIPDRITDGVDGLLVPAGDPPALTAALAAVLDDPVLAGRLADGGRRGAAACGHDGMVDAVVAAYADAVAGPRPERAPAGHPDARGPRTDQAGSAAASVPRPTAAHSFCRTGVV